jgi:hypothetical protein
VPQKILLDRALRHRDLFLIENDCTISISIPDCDKRCSCNDGGFSQYIQAAEREKDLPELLQPRNLLIASEKPFRKISKRFFDTTVSLSTVPSSVLEIH